MGYNTAVLVLNDALGCIEDDPDFGMNLARAIRYFNMKREPIDISSKNHVNAATVISCEHADADQVVVFGKNMGWPLSNTFYNSPSWPKPGQEEEWKLAVVRNLAGQLGYNLTKKRGRK